MVKERPTFSRAEVLSWVNARSASPDDARMLAALADRLMIDGATRNRLERDLDEAEAKAWDSLARYKFQMFGYWAAIWVHLNRIGDFRRRSPFKELVATARAKGHGVGSRACEGAAAHPIMAPEAAP